MLEISRLDALRSDQEIFRNVTFSIHPGQWCWVRGGNGCGKSTLLKILAGLLPANRGAKLSWKGVPITRFASSFLQDLFFLGHTPPLHPALTPLENLQWLNAIANVKDKNDIEHLNAALLYMGITKMDKPCEQLSFGQKQRVSLARLLFVLGKLWILDEPATGLDNLGQQRLEKCLKDHLTHGGVAVIASHIGFKNIIPPEHIIELKAIHDFHC